MFSRIISREKIETILGFVICVGILLPVRVLFYTYVSDYWLGSAGVLSVAIFCLWYYSQRKPKLGYVGKLIIKDLNWVQTGRKPKVVIIMAGLGIAFMGSFIGLYLMGSSTYGETKALVVEAMPPENRVITTERALELYKETTPEQMLSNLITSIPLMFSRLEILSVTLSLVDDMTSGYMMHFCTVALVEEIEGLTIFLLYRRYVWKRQMLKQV